MVAGKKILRIKLAQMNTKVCDIEGNLKKIIDEYDFANAEKVDLLVTPELSISGYPLEDAVENPDVLNACRKALDILIEYTRGKNCGLMVGMPYKTSDGKIINTTYVINDGGIDGFAEKKHRPNYGVFDEVRNFAEGEINNVITFKDVKIGVLPCQDTWEEDVARKLADQGAELLISVNSSPYEAEKHLVRKNSVVKRRCQETGLPMMYLNQVGGQDELVFDGGSFASDPQGNVIHEMKAFVEQSAIFDVSFDGGFQLKAYGVSESYPDVLKADYSAITLAVRDYCAKTGMTSACLGMSGGIDSALVAAIAVDALGAENVLLVSMPSNFTADESNTLAYDEASRLGAKIISISIEDIVDQFRSAVMNGLGKNTLAPVTDENFQPRTRGTVLMAITNNTPGMLLLSTGNKSETAVGYTTIYGDMNGGYNPVMDVYKMDVFALSNWRNTDKPEGALGPDGEVIPTGIIGRPPSAELREGQRDSDSLPPYPILDQIIKAYAQGNEPLDSIIAKADLSAEQTLRIVRMIDIAEWKRRQSCPGAKISGRNFGRDRRYPIASAGAADVRRFIIG